ncbi:heavy metal translocating P-type ATPase [Paraliobacillus ryukyuensis]|uniref:heavy metal translocating P-type ATPase n=1 Tax=Paraliobacillus ryukyuensis TaxID=200904 RepID=UPI0009A666FA|nr:cation-translocating P-type ATPase [Paraliobacillus ryukyuensis]
MIVYVNKHKNHITAISAILIALGYIASFLGNGEVKSIALITATIIASLPIAIKAYQALRMKAFSIELLVIIAVIGALFIGEYVESAVVTFLFLMGAFLEARTLAKTRSSLKELIEMAPQEATVIQEGKQVTVPIEDVVEGDRVIIRSGGKIPVDGEVVTGNATLNEAAITGESRPASKSAGEKVFSGTILDNGYIEMVAEKVGDETTFARMIELVEEAQESKSKTEKFLDRFATVYTPAIVILSILVFAITRNLHLAITFLVVACPGALVIGAPVSTVAGIGNGAKNGVLIKGGEIIDQFSKVNTLVFDKTGTLTKGKPEVTDFRTFGNYEQRELLRLMAQGELISEHPLGQIIVKEAKTKGIALNQDYVEGEVIKGNGIRAKVENHSLVIGNRKLMQTAGITISTTASSYAVEREELGSTAIFAAIDGELAGIISITDQIREAAPQAIAALRENGIDQIIMLTGDNKRTAKLVATQLGIDEYHAEFLPENKVEFITELKRQGRVVAMAGDGINDAPAIATADIGLAMGEGGTDVSMETADVVLMADKLLQLSHAYALAKATSRNMKQNTYSAVAIVFVLLFGVLMGSVQLASGMFIHEASVLLVIVNAMRLVSFKSKQKG